MAQGLSYRLARVLAFVMLLPALIVNAEATPLLLVDMQTSEVLLAQEAGRSWYPASLTKLTTAFVTFRAIQNGRVNLNTPVIISARAAATPPGKSGLREETAVSMQDALNLLIVKSANDIAVAIAETVSGSVERFVAEMNETAQVLGMSQTNYVNPHGLHDPAQVTSARDLAIIALAIRQHYPQYSEIFATSVVRLGEENMRSHNNLLTKFAGTTGMKTGFVCSAGLNLVATIERGGQQLLAVVLGSSSERERGEMAAQMVVDYLAGRIGGTGRRLGQLPNDTGVAPVNMRPNICGADAKAYVAEREAAFPLGLSGQPSYLVDRVATRSYLVTPLGRLRVVTLPRPRPDFAPAVHQEAASLEFVVTSRVAQASSQTIIPLPRPRPHR